MMPASGQHKKSRKLYFAALFAIIVLGSVALVYGVTNWAAEQRAKKMPNPVPVTEESLKTGLKIYNDHCVQCHGDKGDGKGEKSAQLSTEPGNFTDPQKMHGLTDGELYWQITKGHNPMPGYEDKLTPLQRWQAVIYIRAFASPSQPVQTPNATSPQQPAPSNQP